METRKTIVIPRGKNAYDALISNKRLFENYLVIGHKNFTQHLPLKDGVTVLPLPKADLGDILFINDVELSPNFNQIAVIKYDERRNNR